MGMFSSYTQLLTKDTVLYHLSSQPLTRYLLGNLLSVHYYLQEICYQFRKQWILGLKYYKPPSRCLKLKLEPAYVNFLLQREILKKENKYLKNDIVTFTHVSRDSNLCSAASVVSSLC